MSGIEQITSLCHSTDMPAYTEARIQHLCKKVIDARSPLQAEKILRELRAALEEHIRLANESLAAQASVIPVISGDLKRRIVRKPKADC